MNSDSSHDVFIELSDVLDFTDEDFGDKNLDGCHTANKQSWGHLLALAKLCSRKNEIDDNL